MQRVKSPYPSTQDAAYEQALRAQVAAPGPDAPVSQLLDADAVREHVAAPLGTGMGPRMQVEQVLALNSWLTDYDVRVAV